jgi:hypothetical protein
MEKMFEEIGKPVAADTFLPPPQMTPEELKRLQSIAGKEQDQQVEEEVFKEDKSQSIIDPATTEENRYDDKKSQEEQHEDYEEETGDHMEGPAYETFEQELHGTPEGVEVETEYRGMGIAVDYIVFSDGEQNRIVQNPNRYYNSGPLSLQREGTISFSFADCHTECVRPEGISSVYLVHGDANDEDIINNAIDDSVKAEFEQIDSKSFQFKVPNGITGSNTYNKLVIETEQADGISAFYIHEGVEVS